MCWPLNEGNHSTSHVIVHDLDGDGDVDKDDDHNDDDDDDHDPTRMRNG